MALVDLISTYLLSGCVRACVCARAECRREGGSPPPPLLSAVLLWDLNLKFPFRRDCSQQTPVISVRPARGLGLEVPRGQACRSGCWVLNLGPRAGLSQEFLSTEPSVHPSLGTVLLRSPVWPLTRVSCFNLLRAGTSHPEPGSPRFISN